MLRPISRPGAVEHLRARPLGRRCVTSDFGEVPYDFLVLATGAEPNYFGRDAWEAIAPSPKSLEATLDIRRRLITALEQAEVVEDPVEQRLLLEIVIVGGGPTGVEFAGALADARPGLAHYFRRVDSALMRVHLVQSNQRVLPSFPEDLSKKAAAQLEKRGVTLHLSKRVTAVDVTGVSRLRRDPSRGGDHHLDRGRTPRVASRGAVRRSRSRARGRRARLLVARPPGGLRGRRHGSRGPRRGLAAGGEPRGDAGRTRRRPIVRSLQRREREPSRFFDKGSLAQIGHYRAIAQVGRLHLSGCIAWLIWALVHVYLSGGRPEPALGHVRLGLVFRDAK